MKIITLLGKSVSAPMAAVCLFIFACFLAAGEKASDVDMELARLREVLVKAKTQAERLQAIESISMLRSGPAAEYLASIVRKEIKVPATGEEEDALRAYALRSMADNGLPGTEKVASGALSDSSAVVRAAAVYAWGRFIEKPDFDRLAAFFSDESPLPQVEAARLLGRLRGDGSKRILLAQFENRHAQVREAVIAALASWRSELDLLKLRKPLLSDSDSRVRIAAAQLVASQADPSSVDLLIDAFIYEKPPEQNGGENTMTLNAADVNDALMEILAAVPPEAADAVIVERKLPLEMKIEPFRRAFVIRLAGRRRIPVAVKQLKDILVNDAAENRELAAVALGSIGSPEAEKPLFDYFEEGGFDAKLAALKALANLRSLESMEKLIKISRIQRWEIKVVALEALGRHPAPEAVKRLAAALSENPWQMQIAAVRALRVARKKECIGPLVEALAAARGRLRAEILDALWDYTQEVKSENVADWRTWWKKAIKNYAIPDEPYTTRPERVAPKAYAAPLFSGRRIDSERVVLILDVSEGMWQKKGNQPRVVMKTALRELENYLKKLGRHVDFNIILMGEKPSVLWSNATAATAKTKREAAQFLAGMKESGFAGFDRAIDKALDDPDADTLIIITTGPEPPAREAVSMNSGDSRLPDSWRTRDFLNALGRRNRTRMAAIHIFTFGGRDGFLELLASGNSGGVYRIPLE